MKARKGLLRETIERDRLPLSPWIRGLKAMLGEAGPAAPLDDHGIKRQLTAAAVRAAWQVDR